jgi:hypothetical protein
MNQDQTIRLNQIRNILVAFYLISCICDDFSWSVIVRFLVSSLNNQSKLSTLSIIKTIIPIFSIMLINRTTTAA